MKYPHRLYILLLPLILVSGCQATVSQLNNQHESVAAAKEWYLNGDLLTAEQHLNQLHVRGLASLQSWRLMGNIQFRQNRLDAAESAYQAALQLAPSDRFSWHNLALVKLRKTTMTLMQARSQLGELSHDNARLLEQLLRLQRVELQ